MIRAFQFLCKLCRALAQGVAPGVPPEPAETDLEKRLERMTEIRPVSVARAVLFRTRQ